MSGAPRVTVAIACRDDVDALELTLDNLFAQAGATWEAVVVDHRAVDEDTRARLAALRWPGTRVVHVAPRAGPSAAQAAADAAEGLAVLFLQAGDRLAPTALQKLAGALDADADAVVAVSADGPSPRRPGLVRRSALTSAILASDDPVASLLEHGVRSVRLQEALVIAAIAHPREPRRSVRARSLVTTASPPGAAVPDRPDAGWAPAAPSLELGEALRRLDELASALREARHEIAALRASASWRITAPLRLAHRWLTRKDR